MMTALDTSVLLDVIVADPNFADRSETALRRAASEGALSVSECVVAELRPALSADELGEFFADWGLVFTPSTQESALLAGEMYEVYLRRQRKTAKRVVADFLIGAQAKLGADRILARDRGYYRDYFTGLRLIEP